MTSTIQDHAIIGDGRSCALVARSGSIDFLCWPRFDSDACLAALLGDERHGYLAHFAGRLCFADRPPLPRRYSRSSRPSTVTDTGRVRVTDLMPWREGPSAIIRIVEGLEGEVQMAMSLRLRFGYGQTAPWSERHERGLIFEAGPDRVVLDCPVELAMDGDGASARFMMAKGAKIAFVLSHSPSTAPMPSPLRVDALIDATEKAWKGWIGRHEAKGRWDGAIRRSLITLRTLIDRESGGIVAAATLGLPEIPGGSANWDYRYCWLRDSTFTLTALLNAGFHEEATRWRDWILRALGGQPAEMQIVYRIDGGRLPPERELDWAARLSGRRAGPRRQRRVRPDATRRLWRVDGQFRRPGQGRHRAHPARRRSRDRHRPASREGVGQAQRRHLGKPWRSSLLHLFAGDGLGGRHPLTLQRMPTTIGPIAR